MKTTVTYSGASSALVHGRPGCLRHLFYRGRPLKIQDKDDIEFYRQKEESGSQFHVLPKGKSKKLQAHEKSEKELLRKEQAARKPKDESNGVWSRAAKKKTKAKPKSHRKRR